MATTTNYAFDLPIVGGNQDTWGGLLNGNWTALDTELKAVSDAAAAAFPSGGIIMWSGSIASIPTGWYLCDGLNGTPNLQDKFIVGAGSAYAVGATGGAATVTLSTAEIPSHTHSFSGSGTTSTTGAHTHTVSDQSPTGSVSADWDAPNGAVSLPENTEIRTTSSAGDHSHTFSVSGTTGAAGSGGAHENRPPYYALAYIMKA